MNELSQPRVQPAQHELVLDLAESVVALRPVPVAVVAGAEAILLRADGCIYAWLSRADNAIVVASLSEPRELAKTLPSLEAVEMLGFVGDSLRYRVGGALRELRFSVS